MKKLFGFILVLVLLFTLIPLQETEAATVNKHYTVNVAKLDVREKPSPKAKIVGSLKKGAVVFVYNTEPGGWSKIKYNNKAGYVATSGLKSNTAVKSFKNYNGDWYDSADDVPGMRVTLEFTSNDKANIDLYGAWWSMPDASNARVSDASGYNIIFDKSGIGKVKFKESYGGNVGIATVKLIGSYIHLKIEYPSGISGGTYIYEGNHKLARWGF